MALANTILAGAQKSGTTALCRFLGAHPHCHVSEPKETNYFSRADNLAHLGRYERCFRGAGPERRVRIDGTTTYMADPAVAGRIRATLGENAKIIFILRSPAARSYSSYLHMLKRGHERRTADEVFLSLPDDPAAAACAERAAVSAAAGRGRVAKRPYARLYDDLLWNYRYVGNSLYASLIDSFLAVFPGDNVQVIFFEEVAADPAAAGRVLGGFLDVDPTLFPATLPSANVTRVPDPSTPWGWLVEQGRWLKNGNLTLVRPSEIAASPLVASPPVRDKLNGIFKHEVAYWSGHSGRDLRTVGW